MGGPGGGGGRRGKQGYKEAGSRELEGEGEEDLGAVERGGIGSRG